MSVETQGKSLVDLLDMLEPAPPPAPVSMVPQTWGWLVLGCILLGIVVGVLVYLLHRHRANAYRRAALQELSAAENDPAKISQILRRTALAAYPRAKVASLAGDDWIKFLSEGIGNNRLSEKSILTLRMAPYTDTAPDEHLTQFARHWIKAHKPGGGR